MVSMIGGGAILNALEGVCYIADSNGLILDIGGRNWTSFAEDAGCGDVLRLENVIGRNIFDYIDGQDVLKSYSAFIADVIARPDESVSFLFRCDAPDVRREMRMNISGICEHGNVVGVLFQSLTVDERERPAISLFDAAARARTLLDTSTPIVSMCSYCHDVRGRVTSDVWVSPEIYYAAGGTERVRISHGICEKCHKEKIVQDA